MSLSDFLLLRTEAGPEMALLFLCTFLLLIVDSYHYPFQRSRCTREKEKEYSIFKEQREGSRSSPGLFLAFGIGDNAMVKGTLD